MRRLHAWILMGMLSAGGVRAEEDYYYFTDAQGRTMGARITACDLTKNKVTLEREDNKLRVTVAINAFTEADQAYIKEWYLANEMLSEKNLKVGCKEITTKKWKEKKVSDVIDARSGSSFAETTTITTYEQIAYDVTLQNMGGVPLKNMRMEYRIYYEQSQTEYGNPKPVQEVFKASMKVQDLEMKKQAVVSTQPVKIFKVDINDDSMVSAGVRRVGGKGNVHGFRARLYLTLPSGKEVVREVSHPTSLSETRYPW